MKKLIFAVVLSLFTATTFAQDNALGLRLGSGAEFQYEHMYTSGDVLKVNAGLFDFDGSFFGTCVYNWECFRWTSWTPKAGNWFLQAGVGGALGVYDNGEKSKFNIGLTGDVAFGIHFKGAPISLAVDYRPTLFLLNDSFGDGFGSIGLSCVFRF